MFESLYKLYYQNGFEICIICVIIIIFILYLYNLFYSKKGNWSRHKTVDKNGFELSLGDIDKNTSKLELKSKFILESIFRRPFFKIRPDFLKNEVTGQNLEIDLYNNELKLGIEVNGNQHYKFTPFFQKTEKDFREQRYRDVIKKILCREKGITLIEIPYSVGEDGLKPYILQQLRLNGYKV
jgi:hypothetical protein